MAPGRGRRSSATLHVTENLLPQGWPHRHRLSAQLGCPRASRVWGHLGGEEGAAGVLQPPEAPWLRSDEPHGASTVPGHRAGRVAVLC